MLGDCCLRCSLEHQGQWARDLRICPSPCAWGGSGGGDVSGTWWLLATWNLQCSLESAVHGESMQLIYVPDFLPRKNVRTGRDIGDLWIHHFISHWEKQGWGMGDGSAEAPQPVPARDGSPASCLPSQHVLTIASNSWISQKSPFTASAFQLTYPVVLISMILLISGRQHLGAMCSSEFLQS